VKLDRRILGWGGVCLLALIVVFWLSARTVPVAEPSKGPVGGDFSMTSASGPVALQDFRGKVVLLYFGYTYCPDICPTSLASTAAGLKLLKPEELDKVAVLFVSVDPERDTPSRLKEYAEFFHPKIVGLTGSKEGLAEVAKRYGVFYARQSVETAGGGYVIDHTSETYVIDSAGALKGKIPHAAPPEQVVETIRRYLSKPSKE
jgi:protein SCO1/2